FIVEAKEVVFQVKGKNLHIEALLFILPKFIPSLKERFRRNNSVKKIFIRTHMQTTADLQNEAPILTATSNLYKEYYQYWKLFPKKDQYLLGEKIGDNILQFMELTLYAVNQSRDQKLKTLESANRKFEMLKVLLRLARDLKLMDNKKYLSLQERLQEIGRM